MTRLSLSLCFMLITVPASAQQGKQDLAALRRQVDAFLQENPAIARDIEAQNIARENLEWMFRVAAAQRGEDQKSSRSGDAAGARAERAIKAALKVVTDAEKIKQEQAVDLYAIVFPKAVWDASYEAYLKEVPGVAKAVESGRITREKVIAGIKARAGERPPTEEEQLAARYQELLQEDRTLGRIPKAALMPRLKAMLARGEGKNLRPGKTTRQRRMTFGLYFNDFRPVLQ